MTLVVKLSLLFIVSLCMSFGHAQDISMRAWITCVRTPGDVINAKILMQDENQRAIRFDAIAGNGAVRSNCQRSGSGTQADPWIVETDVDLGDDTESNPCGVQTITSGQGGNKIYRWLFKAYPSSVGGLFQGRAFALTAECDVDSATVSGIVDTSKPFRNLLFGTSPQNPGSVTAPNTYATGSQVDVTATIYPGSSETPDELQGYVGYFITNCYVASDEDFTTDVSQYIDGNGCPVPGASITAPSYELTSLAGESPLEYQTTVSAITLAGNKRIHHQCDVWGCTIDNKEQCTGDPCEAYKNGVSPVGTENTGLQIRTSYDVQDKNAQDLHVAFPTTVLTPISQASNGSSVVLVVTAHPYGIGSNADMRGATGFYAYSCVYAQNANFNNAVTFIDSSGCPVNNPLLNVANGFSPNAGESDAASNRYVLTTGDAELQYINGGRLWVRCNTGICTDTNHNYCKNNNNNGRCGASNNLPNEHARLGFQGLDYTFFIFNPNNPAIDFIITGPDGNPTTPNTVVGTGQGLPFQALIVPGAGGVGRDIFSTASGAYVRNCVTTITKDSLTSSYEVIDDGGCRVPGLPVSFSEPCRDASTIPGRAPFSISCGDISVTVDGEVQTTCKLGLCNSTNNDACDDRCAAGSLINNPGAYDLDITPSTTSSFTARDRGIGNTAYYSEQIRRLLVALAVVLPLVFCADSEQIRRLLVALAVVLPLVFCVGISLFTWLCLRWQKKRKLC